MVVVRRSQAEGEYEPDFLVFFRSWYHRVVVGMAAGLTADIVVLTRGIRQIPGMSCGCGLRVHRIRQD